MELYYFVSDWFFASPIEVVWKEIADVASYPMWWLEFKKATVQSADRKLRLGTRVDYEVKGSLPYTLKFAMDVTAFQPPCYLQFRVNGDLKGDLRYVLDPRAGGTAVKFYWDNGTPKPIMNFGAKLPFVKGMLERNHGDLMNNGYRSLKARVEC